MEKYKLDQYKLYISIDYSLESTGVTFYDGHSYKFFNFINERDKKISERLKNLSSCDDLIIKKYYRDSIASPKFRADGLYGWEQEHMTNVLYYNKQLAKEIKKIALKYNVLIEEVCLIIENYSYGSASDTLIQLVENTMTLKRELINNVVHINNFFCIPAPKVKQYAGKGNYDKYQMGMAFLQKGEEDNILSLSSFYKKMKSSFESDFCKEKIKKGKKIMEVQSPISDIIDSWWILSYFLNVPINKQL